MSTEQIFDRYLSLMRNANERAATSRGDERRRYALLGIALFHRAAREIHRNKHVH